MLSRQMEINRDYRSTYRFLVILMFIGNCECFLYDSRHDSGSMPLRALLLLSPMTFFLPIQELHVLPEVVLLSLSPSYLENI